MAVPQSAQKWSGTGRASDAEKQPTGRVPQGCVENGPAAALLVGYVPHHFHAALETKSTRSIESGAGCALLAPCRRPILNATTSSLYARRYTSSLEACSGANCKLRKSSSPFTVHRSPFTVHRSPAQGAASRINRFSSSSSCSSSTSSFRRSPFTVRRVGLLVVLPPRSSAPSA
jgi:hypothetical protein